MSGDAFLITGPRQECGECWGCVRVCPVNAIRVRERRSEVVPERCVRCGACVTSCGSGAHTVRDDVPRVRALLASGRPVVAMLATEWRAALHPMTLADVEWALAELGFSATETTLLGEELVAEEYERALSGAAGTVLRSTCPVAAAWVTRYHPALSSMLVPVLSPYLAQARLIRRFYPEDTAIVYVSPCFARKDEIDEPGVAGLVDAAIGFDELRALVGWPASRVPPGKRPAPGCWKPDLSKVLSLTDGFPRTTLEARDMTARDVVSVRGPDQLSTLLGAIERGETGPLVVDMLYCTSCIDGPTVGSELSSYARRALFSESPRGAALAAMPVDTRSLLEHLPPLSLGRSFAPDPVQVPHFSDAEIDACLAEGEFADRRSTLDCGACGYETCVEHAIAVLGGDSSWEMCFPLERKRLERTNATLAESATVDAVTGLLNRRAFSERLETEIARHQRYGGPLTLLMIDLDGFKAINDGYGHTTGDAVLGAVGSMMREGVRETDIAARYGGDEFALILPGVGKTAGYAVAEKLRSAVAAMRVPVATEGAGGHVGLTLSVGLAAAGPSALDAKRLLEAADRALYRAKETGRDRVVIAPD